MHHFYEFRYAPLLAQARARRGDLLHHRVAVLRVRHLAPEQY